jgi:flagellar hook-associated protein 3 FlgL
MLRISTASSYSAVLANLTSAQLRQNEAGERVSSEKNGSNLKEYAHNAEVLTAMRGVRTKVDGFLAQTQHLGGRLDMQEVAMTRVADSMTGARESIADSLAAGDGATLSQALSGFFADAAAALNMRHEGRYLFAGGRSEVAPVTTTSMADLASPATVAAQFENDDMIVVNRLDESTTMETGFLASDLGTPFFNTIKQIRDYTDANGAFTNPLSEAQKTFLTARLGELDGAVKGITDATARNGLAQKRLESARTDLQGRANTLEGLMGDAISKLKAAEVSVQAAAQVFTSLMGSSLLNVLQP